MSILDMQSAIAKLCVDNQFRLSFLESPDLMLDKFDLTTKEAGFIKELDMYALQDYALSLIYKRSSIIKRWLPCTIYYLEQFLSARQVADILKNYTSTTICESSGIGGDWIRSELPKLQQYFLELSRSGRFELPYLEGIVEFEVTLFTMDFDNEVSYIAGSFTEQNKLDNLDFSDINLSSLIPIAGKHLRLSTFEFDVAELVECIKQQEPVPEFIDENTCILFFKGGGMNKTIAHKVNLPLKELLEMCIGNLSATEIINITVDKYAEGSGNTRADVIEDCAQILQQLHELGAITFIKQ